MSVDDLVGRQITNAQGSPTWTAEIVNTAATLTDEVFVLIPGIDNSQYQHGPCRWMPRDTDYPTAGDVCLVIFDDDANPWIAAWSPS